MARWARAGQAAAVVCGLLLVGLSIPAAQATSGNDSVHFSPGAPDLGDPLAPGLGNGGYQVSHYDIDLHYEPTTGVLIGDTVVDAVATQNLSRFDLDFALTAKTVTVNGLPAKFKTVPGPKFSYSADLVVTPKAGIKTGTRMRVEVTYRAKPGRVKYGGYSDWRETPTGIMSWDEPIAATEWWFPGNDYPSDKATYDVTVTVPKGHTIVTNGTLLSRTVHGSDLTEHWQTKAPMASYLAIMIIGRYDVVKGTVLGDVPSYTAYESGGGVLMARARRDVSQTPDVLKFLQSTWGRYPFASAGGIVWRYLFPTAFETQNRPTYAMGMWENNPHDIWAVVHENAHQWFGDSVTASRWRHFWLAEGFATYSEWVWSKAQGDGTPEQLFLSTYGSYPKDDPFWQTPVAKPYYALIIQQYERGAMTLQALRNRVGTKKFFAIMRGWAATKRHTSQSTKDFTDYAQQVSGVDLAKFFHVWLYSAHRPAPTEQNGFPPKARAALASGSVTPPRSFAPMQQADAALAAAEATSRSR